MSITRVFIVLLLLLFAGPYSGFARADNQSSYGPADGVTYAPPVSDSMSSNCTAHDLDKASLDTGTLGFGSRAR